MTVDLIILGSPDPTHTSIIERSLFHRDTSIAVVMDKGAIIDPLSIDKIVALFSADTISPFDLFLLLSESMSNAVTYGNIETLGITARQRGSVLLLTFFHIPGLDSKVDDVLLTARKGWLPDFEKDPPNGLGFPILMRLTNKITISLDRTRLQFWIDTRKGKK